MQPSASAALICAAVSDGGATKKSLIGTDVPGVEPLAQLGPDAFVRSDGAKASLGRIFWLRNVVNTVLAIIPMYGIVDALLIFGEARQCVHDKIADTIVIKA